MDRLAALIRTEWVGYWRRLFRGGNAAKNNLFLLSLIALLSAGKYISFLQSAHGREVWYLLGAVFAALALSLRNEGPLTDESLGRFPLTARERFAFRVYRAVLPPWSWIVLIYAAGACKPAGIPLGAAVILAGIAASQIPFPEFSFRPKSRAMTLLRKEIRYILQLPEHTFVLLISVAFCIYLAGGQGIQADAFRAVLGLLSILSSSAPMNAFAMEGTGGMDRYGLSPLTGARIVWTKNLAFLTVVAAQRAPILALAAWRLGVVETAYGAVEAASLALLTLAWGNYLSVRRPAPPASEPLILDGLIGFVASALPAAATIGVLRSGSRLASVEMLAMLAVCGAFWWGSLGYAGGSFTRHFDRIRAVLAG